MTGKTTKYSQSTQLSLTALAVSLLTVAVFLPSVNNGFVNWDDQLYIYENPYIQSLDINFLKWMFSFKETLWVPVTRLSHGLAYAVWGINPGGHHLVNIIIHGLNAFLIVLITHKLFKSAETGKSSPRKSSIKGYALIAAGLTGILFGIHPLRVESVAWIAERKDVLSGFFILSSLLCYLQYSSNSAKNQKRNYYLLSTALFILALGSKPMAVTVPVIMLILDFYPLQRVKVSGGQITTGQAVLEKAPFFAFTIALSAATLIFYESEGVAVTSLSGGITERLLIALQSLSIYLWKIAWPVNLAPMYPYPSEVSLYSLPYLVPVLLFAAISIYSLYMWKKQKVWAAAWIYYISTLLPVLGVVKFGYFAAADRYTYLPGLGPMILISAGTVTLFSFLSSRDQFRNTRHAVSLAAVLVIFSLSILTVKQAGIWKDSISLWTAQVRQFPDSHLGHMNLAQAYVKDGDYRQAISVFNKIEKLYPSDMDNYYNRGIAYGMLGEHHKAIGDFITAVQLSHGKAGYYNELGVAYGNTGDFHKAIENLNEAIKLDPDLAKAYYFRGMAYRSIGLSQLFIKDFQSAARKGHPSAIEYLNSIGIKW